ncbi:MAG: helical backbone metal receptor [Polyangiaceae bacterium]
MTSRRRAFAVLAIAALAATLAACSRPKPRDSTERRIVSLSPSTTEAAFAIGAGPEVVGRSRYCDYPEAVKTIPEVGGYVDPNFEAIVALRPTLVIGARGPLGPDVVSRLEAHGATTFFPPTESFATIEEMILGLGDRTARTKEARAVVEGLREKRARIESAVRGKPKVRVLMVFGFEPIVVAGPRSFADEMLRRAGAENVVQEGDAYPTLGIERVIALEPDVVLNSAMAETKGKSRISKDAPGWKEVRAVKNDKVLVMDDESVLRPGPRVVDGLRRIAAAVHPDVTLP